MKALAALGTLVDFVMFVERRASFATLIETRRADRSEYKDEDKENQKNIHFSFLVRHVWRKRNICFIYSSGREALHSAPVPSHTGFQVNPLPSVSLNKVTAIYQKVYTTECLFTYNSLAKCFFFYLIEQ